MHILPRKCNTSSVSVPLTIISELKQKLEGQKTLLLSAFGVGMTWATGVVSFADTKISEIVEVENGMPVDMNLHREYSPIETNIEESESI